MAAIAPHSWLFSHIFLAYRPFCRLHSFFFLTHYGFLPVTLYQFESMFTWHAEKLFPCFPHYVGYAWYQIWLGWDPNYTHKVAHFTDLAVKYSCNDQTFVDTSVGIWLNNVFLLWCTYLILTRLPKYLLCTEKSGCPNELLLIKILIINQVLGTSFHCIFLAKAIGSGELFAGVYGFYILEFWHSQRANSQPSLTKWLLFLIKILLNKTFE